MSKFIKKILIFIVLNLVYVHFSGQEFTFKNVGPKDGLPSVEVYHAIQDTKGYIWFATNNGVSRFDGYSFENFDISNGLVNDTVFDLFEDTKGRIWFIALSGRLCYYENGQIKQYKYNYLIDKNILYKYQLLPFDKKWRRTHSTAINYSALPPGNYEFKIMAMGQNGTWSNVNNTLKFEIDFPFYKKWWFYLAIVVFIVGLVVLFLQNTLKKIKVENQQRQELKKYAQKSVATQLNPHFIFNSLNSLNYLILKDNKLESSKYLAKLSVYLRTTFDALQKDNLTLNDEIKIVSQYLKLEKVRLKEKLNYEIVLDEQIDSAEYKIPGLFILPLLENALWKRIQARKSDGFVKISVEKHKKFIQVLVEDNGIISNLDEIENGQGKFIEQRKQLLNDFYKGQIVFDFIPNTKVSFNETGNIVILKLLN